MRALLMGAARRFGTTPLTLGIAIGVLLVLLILMNPAARWAAAIVFATSVVAVGVQGQQCRPIRGWGIVLIVSFAATLLGGAFAPEPDLNLHEPLEGPVLGHCTEADEPRG